MKKTYLFTFGDHNKRFDTTKNIYEVAVTYDEKTSISDIVTFIRGKCDEFYPELTTKDIKGTKLGYYVDVNEYLCILVVVKEIGGHYVLY